MAEPNRTIRVCGLPPDVDHDRLKDKLLVHFLRKRNGGGEIQSIDLVQASPASALIAFEENEVAQRVLQHRQHVLEVDGKKHALTLSVHHENLDPDKVVFSLLASINYTQLPGGWLALTRLQETHPNVQTNFTTEGICTLNGAYSNVQAALDHLLGSREGPQSMENGSSQPDLTDLRSHQASKTLVTHGSENRSRKSQKQREERLTNDQNKSAHLTTRFLGHGAEGSSQVQGADVQSSGPPKTTGEDFSMIVDAGMFQYLKKNYQKEFQQILSQNGVEVEDVTNQGLTTLLLQALPEVRESGQELQRLEMALKAIRRLYQENETRIRQVQLPKSKLPSRKDLQRAKESVAIQLPKLLLNEDAENIYIIGNSSDVSEAQQILLVDYIKLNAKKDSVASLLRHTSQDTSPGHNLRASSVESSPNDGTDRPPSTDEHEAAGDGTRRCKLAARFKDLGLPTLASRPVDLISPRLQSSGRQTYTGPTLGRDLFMEKEFLLGERFSRAESQNTGVDILFKNEDSTNSFTQNKTQTSNVMDNQHKHLTLSLSNTHSSMPEHPRLSTPASGTSLKRANSFSGTSQQMAQILIQKSQDDSGRTTVKDRARSSSFNLPKPSDSVHSAEIAVPHILWQYVKEAYKTRLDNLTTDVLMKDRHSDKAREQIVTLTGAQASKVTSCQQELQKLLESVRVDFSVQELKLSELGVADPADDTLRACCTEVCNRFKKVTAQVLKNSLFLMGPKELCSKVAVTLQEVFTGNSMQTTKHRDASDLPFNRKSSTFLRTDEEESALLRLDGADRMASWGLGRDHEETENLNGQIDQQLLRKDPVTREKIKVPGTLEMDEDRYSAAGNGKSSKRGNGVGSAVVSLDKAGKRERSPHPVLKDGVQYRQGETWDIPLESKTGLHNVRDICVCGNSGTSLVRTRCGAALCAKCLEVVHVHCRVCHETDPTPQGIQGTMSHNKLNFSVPGHHRDQAIKITYCIPDGIQGSDHPSPGKPFQGGVFEAFLPDCEKARKLLPRLEKAFRQGLVFTITSRDSKAKVTWDSIPHKTSLHGGKSGSGYPDSSYLNRLSEVLKSCGIGEQPTTFQK